MSTEKVAFKVFFAKRCIGIIFLVLAVIVVNFILIHIAPGDPVLIMIGPYQTTEEYVQMVREMWGLDKPIYVQLWIYLTNVLSGNLGYSYTYKQPVLSLILEKVPATILLMATQLIFSSIIGVLLGLYSAKKRGSKTDKLIAVISSIAYSTPEFWLGQMLIIFFGVWLGILPISGMTSLRGNVTIFEYMIDVLRHLIIPALALGCTNLALVTRFTRTSTLEILRLDYITLARAKGLSERVILLKHALKNALLPIITLIGYSFGLMFGGAVLIETVCGWPGLGRLSFEAISRRDYPLLLGILIVVSIMVGIVNLITDLVYGLLDPRIRHR